MSTATLNDDVVYALVNQQESTYYKENKKNPDGPKDYLGSSRERMILPVGFRIDEKGHVYKIRYIKGCPIIDVLEQDKNGWKPNPRVDQIIFAYGQLIVSCNGEDDALMNFLANDTRNKHAPNRKETSEVVFEELRNSEVAKTKLTTISDKVKAMNIVYEMAKQGESGWEYDEPKLKFFASLFGLEHFTNPEIAERLSLIADSEPQSILNALPERKDAVRALLANALSFSVLGIEKEGAFIQGVNNNSPFIKFSKAAVKEDRKLDEIALYLLLPLGAPSLKQLKDAVQLAQEQTLEKIE